VLAHYVRDRARPRNEREHSEKEEGGSMPP
jgi:hypothetical protein